MASQSHENLISFRKVSQSSDRKFGVTVGSILMVIALWPHLRHHLPVKLWLFALGVVLVGLGLAAPRLLAPLNRFWARLGLVLASITNPIVMGVMYAVAIVPLGWLLRVGGHDLLRLKRDADCQSYWIARDPNEPVSLTKQF